MSDRPRCILHFDIDAFYAQVEEVRNPTLRNLPLGITQKYLIVTCNYVARAAGVTKLMNIAEAIQRCPALVLVSGEDLTPYRQASEQILTVLRRYGPAERLGLDEVWVDATQEVHRRVASACASGLQLLGFCGNVYASGTVLRADSRHRPQDLRVEAPRLGSTEGDANLESSNMSEDLQKYAQEGWYPVLAMGSAVAAEARQCLLAEAGYRCCAGIALNKMLAKLCGGLHKPNDQTVMLPPHAEAFVAPLALRALPGVGRKVQQQLQGAFPDVETAGQLRALSKAQLVAHVGVRLGGMIFELCRGQDSSVVHAHSAPKSITVEDSFKGCSSLSAAQRVLQVLVPDLLSRVWEDACAHRRRPGLLTIKWRLRPTYQRIARSCPWPLRDMALTQEPSQAQVFAVVSAAFKLLQQGLAQPFSLTLINVGVTSFKAFAPRRTSNDLRNLLSTARPAAPFLPSDAHHEAGPSTRTMSTRHPTRHDDDGGACSSGSMSGRESSGASPNRIMDAGLYDRSGSGPLAACARNWMAGDSGVEAPTPSGAAAVAAAAVGGRLALQQRDWRRDYRTAAGSPARPVVSKRQERQLQEASVHHPHPIWSPQGRPQQTERVWSPACHNQPRHPVMSSPTRRSPVANDYVVFASAASQSAAQAVPVAHRLVAEATRQPACDGSDPGAQSCVAAVPAAWRDAGIQDCYDKVGRELSAGRGSATLTVRQLLDSDQLQLAAGYAVATDGLVVLDYEVVDGFDSDWAEDVAEDGAAAEATPCPAEGCAVSHCAAAQQADRALEELQSRGVGSSLWPEQHEPIPHGTGFRPAPLACDSGEQLVPEVSAAQERTECVSLQAAAGAAATDDSTARLVASSCLLASQLQLPAESVGGGRVRAQSAAHHMPDLPHAAAMQSANSTLEPQPGGADLADVGSEMMGRLHHHRPAAGAEVSCSTVALSETVVPTQQAGVTRPDAPTISLPAVAPLEAGASAASTPHVAVSDAPQVAGRGTAHNRRAQALASCVLQGQAAAQTLSAQSEQHLHPSPVLHIPSAPAPGSLFATAADPPTAPAPQCSHSPEPQPSPSPGIVVAGLAACSAAHSGVATHSAAALGSGGRSVMAAGEAGRSSRPPAQARCHHAAADTDGSAARHDADAGACCLPGSDGGPGAVAQLACRATDGATTAARAAQHDKLGDGLADGGVVVAEAHAGVDGGGNAWEEHRLVLAHGDRAVSEGAAGVSDDCLIVDAPGTHEVGTCDDCQVVDVTRSDFEMASRLQREENCAASSGSGAPECSSSRGGGSWGAGHSVGGSHGSRLQSASHGSKVQPSKGRGRGRPKRKEANSSGGAGRGQGGEGKRQKTLTLQHFWEGSMGVG